MNNKIIIFGGTFNPIHNAHLQIARTILKRFKPDKIIFIPCNIPYHKKHQKLIRANHRLEMTRLAVQDEPRFKVSDIEIKKGGKTFSITTIKTLKKEYHPATRFYFIIGSDSLIDLPRWYKVKELVRLCKFITIARPGYPFNDLIKKLPFSDEIISEMKQLYQPDLRFDISSTKIRKNIRLGRSIRKLVPKRVEEYIEKYKPQISQIGVLRQASCVWDA
jgi:nicotinate-nucleotide adenylyltransferase